MGGLFQMSDQFQFLFYKIIISHTNIYATCRCTWTDGDVRFATRYVLEAGGCRKSLHDLVGQSQCVLSEGSSSRNDVLIRRLLLSMMIMSLAFCRLRCDEQLFSHCSVNNSLQYISLFNLSASREKEEAINTYYGSFYNTNDYRENEHMRFIVSN